MTLSWQRERGMERPHFIHPSEWQREIDALRADKKELLSQLMTWRSVFSLNASLRGRERDPETSEAAAAKREQETLVAGLQDNVIKLRSELLSTQSALGSENARLRDELRKAQRELARMQALQVRSFEEYGSPTTPNKQQQLHQCNGKQHPKAKHTTLLFKNEHFSRNAPQKAKGEREDQNLTLVTTKRSGSAGSRINRQSCGVLSRLTVLQRRALARPNAVVSNSKPVYAER